MAMSIQGTRSLRGHPCASFEFLVAASQSGTHLQLRLALVLMTPHHQVQEARELGVLHRVPGLHALVQACSSKPRGSAHFAQQTTSLQIAGGWSSERLSRCSWD